MTPSPEPDDLDACLRDVVVAVYRFNAQAGLLLRARPVRRPWWQFWRRRSTPVAWATDWIKAPKGQVYDHDPTPTGPPPDPSASPIPKGTVAE